MDALHQPFPMLPGRRAQAWRHQPAFRRPRHFHAEPEFNVVLRGRATLGVGHKLLTLGPGDVVFFEPGVDHELVEASTDLELHVIALRPELFARTSPSGRAGIETLATLDAPTLREIPELLRGVEETTDISAIEARLTELFATLHGRFALASSPVRRALRLVGADPSRSEAALAAELGLPASELSRRIQREVGLRFVDLRTRKRLLGFLERIEHGEACSSAALAAGFGSYAQLHRIFTRTLGTNPTRYLEGERSTLAAHLAPLS